MALGQEVELDCTDFGVWDLSSELHIPRRGGKGSRVR